MLKKIVKYGNSCAIILDKALLELLDMTEGSIVKIKTDGVSLTITPQLPLAQETVTPTLTAEGVRGDVIRKSFEKSLGSEKGSAYYKEYEEIMNNYESAAKNKKELPDLVAEMKALSEKHGLLEDSTAFDHPTEAFKKVHEKYSHVLQAVTKLSEDPEYIHETMLLAEKYQAGNNLTKPQEYFEACTQLTSKYIPEYASYQEELKKVAERFDTTKVEKAKTR